MGQGQHVAEGIIVGHQMRDSLDSMELVQKPSGRLPGRGSQSTPAFVDHLFLEETAEGRIGAGNDSLTVVLAPSQESSLDSGDPAGRRDQTRQPRFGHSVSLLP